VSAHYIGYVSGFVTEQGTIFHGRDFWVNISPEKPPKKA
jgi:hypothetical protein